MKHLLLFALILSNTTAAERISYSNFLERLPHLERLATPILPGEKTFVSIGARAAMRPATAIITGRQMATAALVFDATDLRLDLHDLRIRYNTKKAILESAFTDRKWTALSAPAIDGKVKL